MAQSLNIKELSVFFGKMEVVKRVSFSVAAGETYGIVGESGSGKSTILRALSGLHPAWTGSIEMGGQPLGHTRDKKTFRAMQMVFQDPYSSLHPRKTIDRILSEALVIHSMPDRFNKVAKVLEDVGLSENLRYRFPHQLSGGQRQRVAIARALIINPDIILLDEPTSALDVVVQADVLNLLSDLKKERNLTYVMVSHDMGVVAHMCDRVAIMRNGVIEEEMSRETDFMPVKPYGQKLLALSEG